MYVTELKAGDQILITLDRATPAYPTTSGDVVVYKTGKQYKKSQNLHFNQGEGTVILNDSRVLVIRFCDIGNVSFNGVAELDYYAIKSIYLYEGETNAATVAEGLNNKQSAPPSKIYRKKVVLKWVE